MLALTAVVTAGCGSSDGGVTSAGQVSSSSGGAPVVAVGSGLSCAIDTDRALRCWGDTRSDVPTGEFSAVTIGSSGRPCAIRTDGTLACWVKNDGLHMPPSGKFMAVASAQSHSCGLRTDGSVACWGDTRSGEGLPQGKYTAIAAAGAMTCGLRTDRTVVCQEQQQVTYEVLGEFVTIETNGDDLCGFRADRTVACHKIWIAELSDFPLPAGEISAVSLTSSYGCVILAADKSIACWTMQPWGDEHGQATPPAGEFVSIATAHTHACGMRTDKTIACWGNNWKGKATPPPELSG